ncbi:hypothetical protein SAMN04487826_2297 [Prevotella sp. khp1]|nr:MULTISPECIES: hypothetical protein [Prevotellaceae]SDQ66861.1 hypothetical protein SAMN04487826_2297 [Prevotella sp. khp1]
MKKKAYIKPSVQVIELQHRACLLQASGEQPPADYYDDWLD